MKSGLAERLRAAFLGDLEEQLASLTTGLLALEADASSADALKAVFRVMHTLKGAAHATDQPLVERACHSLEATLVEAREGRLTLGPGHFRLLFSAADALADTARRIGAGEPINDDSPIGLLVKRLDAGEVAEEPSEAVAAPTVSSAAPHPGEPKAEPKLTHPPQPPLATRHTSDPVIETEMAESAPAATQSTPSTPSESAVRVSPEKLDALLSQVGRLLAARARVADHSAQVGGIQDAVHGAHAAVRRVLANYGTELPTEVASALRELERSLRDADLSVGGVATRSMEDVRELMDVGDALADSVRRIRMLPFSSACEQLPRLARDVSTDTGKPARIVIAGGDVEADRPVLDAVRESLLHLVRNAIDHGVEATAVREAAGKPAIATITVGAALHGERLTVTVRDDGGGLDIPTIRARLAEQGRVVPDNDADVARTLFEAGFSTRQVATAISGRGVGLDAVEAAMLRVRGTVSVQWAAGQGTTFTLECPLTLAAIRAVLVRCGQQTLALPTSNVEQLLRVRATDVRRAEGREVVLTGSAPIPLVALAEVLGPPFVAMPASDIFPALIISAGERRVALVVDAVDSEQELVIRPVARGRSVMPHLSGGALLGSGQLVLVLNPVSLAQQALGGRQSASITAGPRKRMRILVADDSMTTRSLEQSVLEAAGFDVTTAVDGADAWRKLQDIGADLVVSDIEMPNMDGLTLCRAIRGSAEFANLPVVLVTSLDSPDDRARGMAAGADAYVGKVSAGQSGLLSTVRELLA